MKQPMPANSVTEHPRSILSGLPGPLRERARALRKSLRGWVERIRFPVWLLFQCGLSGKRAVIIWRIAALGDVVCTLPLCAEIRKRHPDRLLIYITIRGFDKIVRMSGLVDLAYAVRHLYGDPAWLSEKTRWFGLIDSVYLPLTTDERLGSGGRLHLVDDLAASCGFTLSDRQPKLFPSRELIEETQIALGLKEKIDRSSLLIAINGGHTWPVREWDAAKWQTLVDRIHADYDAVILQFGVKPNPRLVDDYDKLRGVHSLINRLDQDTLAALIARCDLVVSIDSGPVHVAGAVGTPVVGLFGAVNPLYRLPPDSPAVGVHSDVPCLFCHHETPIGHWKTNCPYEIRCMKQLEVPVVYEAVKTMLARYPKPAPAEPI